MRLGTIGSPAHQMSGMVLPHSVRAVGGEALGSSLKEVDVTAVKKAAPAAKKKAPGSKKAAAKKAAPAAKKAAAVAKKKAPAAQKVPTSAKKVMPKAKKSGAPAATKSTSTPKKATPVAKKAGSSVKKAAAAAKRAAPTPSKATASAAKKGAPTAPKPVVPEKAAFTRRAVPTPPKRPTVGPYAKEPKFLEEQRVLLLEERAVYRGQAIDLRAEADSLALEREPGDVQFDEESGEGGTVTVDRERNLALSAQAGLAVEEIDDALRKIERKSYGGCERCFQPIPKARLRALPFARLCVACKSGGLSRR
jgi:DnaK suppressor protein